jgi:hypothetical protein
LTPILDLILPINGKRIAWWQLSLSSICNT